MRAALVSLLLALMLPLRVGAETVIGGSTEMQLGCLIAPADPAASQIDGSLLFRPTLHAGTGEFELHFQATVGLDPAAQTLSFTLDSLEADAAPWDFLKLSVGRFTYATGAVALLSPVGYWSAVDYDALITGRLADVILPADLVQARLLWEDFALVITAAPFPRRAGLPATDSAWFPKKDFPASIHIGFPVDQTLVLESVTMEAPALPSAQPKTMSASVAASATLGPLDASLLYYHGYDMSPLVQARIDFPYGLYNAFDIILTPVDRIIDSFGLSAMLGVSDFRFSTDLSWTLLKTFATEHLSASTFQTLLATAPMLGYALEAAYESAEPHISVECEWKGCWIPSPPADLVMPLLSSALIGSISVSLLEDRVSLGTSAIVSLQDRSVALAADCSFSPSNEMSFDLVAPFFFGAANTELGEFSTNHLVTIAATWRF